MKVKEYMEAIAIEDSEQALHTLFYEQMFDDDVRPVESLFLSDMIRMKLTGEL